MAYYVAVGTSDGKNIDLKFGEVKEFQIYEINGKEYKIKETRIIETKDNDEKESCESSNCQTGGCSGNGHGCAGSSEVFEKVELIADCRCVLCAKVGFQAQKQFERKAISVFDVSCTIEEAFEKITSYYDKLDRHKSLRG